MTCFRGLSGNPFWELTQTKNVRYDFITLLCVPGHNAHLHVHYQQRGFVIFHCLIYLMPYPVSGYGQEQEY